ncbi:hypothetical protein [Nocardia sp. NPDC058480]|uniref:hypothetical protein n=1 Tax=unclassified Nocardia TaxID=2637762 RepID=UPI003657566F
MFRMDGVPSVEGHILQNAEGGLDIEMKQALIHINADGSTDDIEEKWHRRVLAKRACR